MNRLYFFIVIVSIGLTWNSCVPSKSISNLYNDTYDITGDITVITIAPYGVVKLPGKWTKYRENSNSGQYFYFNKDSIRIAVALHHWKNFEFSTNHPEVTPENFVRKFYEWDATYLKNQTNGELNIHKEDKELNYLIWRLSSGKELREYFLFGLKGQIAYNLYINSAKWDEAKKIEFLEQVYKGH